MDGGAWWAAVHGVAKSQTRLSDFPFTFHFHALEKEMATHSSVLACRIPGTGEPGGRPSMGSHRVGHHWSDLAAAAACSPWNSPDQNIGVGSFPFSRGSSQPRDRIQVSHIAGRFFISWATREALIYWIWKIKEVFLRKQDFIQRSQIKQPILANAGRTYLLKDTQPLERTEVLETLKMVL